MFQVVIYCYLTAILTYLTKKLVLSLHLPMLMFDLLIEFMNATCAVYSFSTTPMTNEGVVFSTNQICSAHLILRHKIIFIRLSSIHLLKAKWINSHLQIELICWWREFELVLFCIRVSHKLCSLQSVKIFRIFTGFSVLIILFHMLSLLGFSKASWNLFFWKDSITCFILTSSNELNHILQT